MSNATKLNSIAPRGEQEDSCLLIDSVIGQDAAAAAVRRAASSRSHLLLIGLPGTGKSMLGQSLAEILPERQLKDVIAQPNVEDRMQPTIRAMSPGEGKELIATEARGLRIRIRQQRLITALGLVLMLSVVVSFFAVDDNLSIIDVMFTFLLALTWVMFRQRSGTKLLERTSALLISREDNGTPFVDASGSTRNILLGDVRHDPYQSGGLETPPHHLLIPGLIHKAHGGVLFVDEIGTLDDETQFHLLTALQEGKLAIEGRSETSSGSVVKSEPVPCRFTLVAAGNIETLDLLHPALRSRIQGFGMEVLMERHLPIDSGTLSVLKQFVIQELKRFHDVAQVGEDAIHALASIAEQLGLRDGYISLQFRELGGILRGALDLARDAGVELIDASLIRESHTRQETLERQLQLQRHQQRLKETELSWHAGQVWDLTLDSAGRSNFQLFQVTTVPSKEEASELHKLLHALSRNTLLDHSELEELSEIAGLVGTIGGSNKFRAATVVAISSYVMDKEIKPNTLVIGDLDGMLRPLPHTSLAATLAVATRTGITDVVAIVSEDRRKFPECHRGSFKVVTNISDALDHLLEKW